jgi:hypothetical protein
MNWAPPLCRHKLAPMHEVGAYASFKKLALGAGEKNGDNT